MAVLCKRRRRVAMDARASAGIVRESVHARVKELCSLLLPSTREGATDGRSPFPLRPHTRCGLRMHLCGGAPGAQARVPSRCSPVCSAARMHALGARCDRVPLACDLAGKALRRATATAYDRLLFWDGGEEWPEHGRGDDTKLEDSPVLGVAAGVYAMRCRGQQQDADRVEQLLRWLSPSFGDQSAGCASPEGPEPESAGDRGMLAPAKRAAHKFLPPGVRQEVMQLESVDAILSALMLLRDSATEAMPENGPADPALPLRKLNDIAVHTVQPLDGDGAGFTLYRDSSFSSVGGVHDHFTDSASSLPGVNPAQQHLLSQKPAGPEHCAQSTGWLFGAVSHGLPPASTARGDSGISALLSLPLLSDSDDALDLISRATTARASPAHQPTALLHTGSLGSMGLGGHADAAKSRSSAVAPRTPSDSLSAADAAHAKGQRSLWKDLFDAASASEAHGVGGHGAKRCVQDGRSELHVSSWHGGHVGKDWWEQCSHTDTGGAVPRPVSESGVEEFERFAKWMEGSSSDEYSQMPVVEQDLVRDLIFLALGLASHTFELCANPSTRGIPSRAGAGEEKEGTCFRIRTTLRLPGVGISPLKSLLLDMCVAGSNVHRLELFIRRNRYGRGKVLGSFCGTLANYLQHYRRQMLSLLPAALQRRSRDADPRPSRSHRDIWEHHMVPPTAGHGSRELCPALPDDNVAFTLQSARAQLCAMDSDAGRPGLAPPGAGEGGGRGNGGGMGHTSGLTVLEVYVHTRKLREQVRILAQLCRCGVAASQCGVVPRECGASADAPGGADGGIRAGSTLLEKSGEAAKGVRDSVRAGASSGGRGGGGGDDRGGGEGGGGRGGEVGRDDVTVPVFSMADSRGLLVNLYAHVERVDDAGGFVWRTLLKHSLQPYLDTVWCLCVCVCVWRARARVRICAGACVCP